MSQQGFAIGIDLGTSYSRVAVFRNDRAEIITDGAGNRSFPSNVEFTDTFSCIGSMSSASPNSLFCAKRLIGRNFSSPSVQRIMKQLPFKIIADGGDRPFMQALVKGESKLFSPEDISTMVFTKMKQLAESHLGVKITQAVITVPSAFNAAQRGATKAAAGTAGFQVLRVMNEPSAAAIAFALDHMGCFRGSGERNILIFDLGGGTCDVSLLTIGNGKLNVKAYASDPLLGGDDFDNCLVSWCVQEFVRKYKKDPSASNRALDRLRIACERAKCILSSQIAATIEVEALFEGTDFRATITRAKFEELCSDLFRNTIDPVERVIRDSKISKASINDIVLVGGSTRIPKVCELLQDFFDGKQLNRSLNHGEAIACGAAVMAAILTDAQSEVLDELHLQDVAPFSLGSNCQFYGTSTFETFHPDPSKHKLCLDGRSSALVLVQNLPERIFKLSDRTFVDFAHTDLEKFFDKHLPASILRPKCKVGMYKARVGIANKKNVVSGIAEFESAAAAASAIEAMNHNGPLKIMTKDDQGIVSLHQELISEVAAIADNSAQNAQDVAAEHIENRKILNDVDSWICSLNNITYHFVEDRFFAKAFPEVGDLVAVEVQNVNDLGADVKLLEFGETKGMLPNSELSHRRIRSFGNLLRVGRIEIVSVIRVNGKAGHIELSKKRVTSQQNTQRNKWFNKSKCVHDIICKVSALTGVPVETLYENIGWPLNKRYGHGFEGMRQIYNNPDILSNYGISEEVKFEVIAKANKLLHSNGWKQLPMHDAALLPKSDFDKLVAQVRREVERESESEFLPLVNLLTGQFFVLNAAGTAYTYRSAEHISAKVREVLLRNIGPKLKLNPVKVRADIEATCFGERGIEAIKDAFREAQKIGDFIGQLPEPGSEKEPSCCLFLQGFAPQGLGCSEANGVQALTRQFAAHAADIIDAGIRCVQTPKNEIVGIVEFKTVEAATNALEAERLRIQKSGKSQSESVVFYQLTRPRITVTLVASPMYFMETITLDQQLGINLLQKAIEVVSAKLASEGGDLKVRSGGQPRVLRATDDKPAQPVSSDSDD